RRLIFVVGGLLLFFGGLYYAIETFFPPDPQVLLVNEATNELSELALEGRWREALDRIDRTKAQLAQPDAELLIWEGVAAEQLGMIERAEAALAEARDLVGEENADLYWVNLGNVRMMGNDLNGAESAAREALAIDPDEPQAYF